MNFRFWKPATEKRSISYFDTLGNQIFDTASGDADADDATRTAIAASVSSLWSYVLASAEVANVTEASRTAEVLAPKWRRQVGIDVILRGQHISAIVIDDAGRLVLRRANACDFLGSGDRARLTFNQPDRTVTRTIKNRGLVDLKWSEHDQRPWLGVSPLAACGYAATGVANVERSMSREVASRQGYILPLPVASDDASVAALKEDIRSMTGNLAVVQSTKLWGAGDGVAKEFQPLRLGPRLPAELIDYRMSLSEAVSNACGVPAAIIRGDADGTATRAAWQRFIDGYVAPFLVIMGNELSEKLETEITLSADHLRRADIALTLARTVGQLVAAGLTVADALKTAGLDE